MSSSRPYDVIVIGVGSMGSAACFSLAKRGYNVLGIDQFDVPHQNSSHTGQSRLIRKAYFEHPDYVPLLEFAYSSWKAFEDFTGKQFYFPTGLLYSGLPENELISGLRQSANRYHIPLDELSPEDQKNQFSQFSIPNHYSTILETDAGFITPEKAILSFVEEAKKLGAQIRSNERVIKWDKDGDGIVVTTNKGAYHAQKLVITAGPWAGDLIPNLTEKLQVTRQLLAWLKPEKPEHFSLENFPCWGIEDEAIPGLLYGFPIMPETGHFGEKGLKVAHHIPGQQINPEEKDRFDEKEEVAKLKTMLDKYLPGAFGKLLQVKSCLYTYSPDTHFIIDHLSDYENKVSFACGFSGHGFKFVPAVGEIMADLAIEGKTDQPIGFLSASRFE